MTSMEMLEKSHRVTQVESGLLVSSRTVTQTDVTSGCGRVPIPAASVRGFSECWPDSLQARWVATSARAVRRPRTHLSSPYARQKAARAAQQRGAGSALGDGVLVSELWVAGFAHRRRWQRGRRRAGRRRGRGLVFIVERCIHDSDASERRVSQRWHLRRRMWRSAGVGRRSG